MTQQSVPGIRFGTSWSTQFRFAQAIGRGLAELKRVDASVHVLRPRWHRRVGQRCRGSDLLQVVGERSPLLRQGRSTPATSPTTGLRTIAWLPQEDRFLFAMAPWTGIESFEQLAAEKPALHMAGSGAEVVLQEYGFSYGRHRAMGRIGEPDGAHGA